MFYLIEKWGNIERDEMYRDFNMGIGMVMILPDEQVEDAFKELEKCGERPYISRRKDYSGKATGQ